MDLSNQIIEKFKLLGFSDNEAKVYIELLKHPNQNGSQIAKELNITRPSAYLALDKLYKKGAVYLVSGNSKDYVAKQPNSLLKDMQTQVNNAAKELMDDLEHLNEETKQDIYFNIEGEENIVQKAKEMIKSARKEIYINTNYPLSTFKRALSSALRRDVRIIVFSFYPINDVDLPIELYQKSTEKNPKREEEKKSITIVSDYETALIAGSEQNENFIGTFSQNQLFVKMISQYIHFDIYLMQFEEKYQINWQEVKMLGTLKERYDL